MRFYHFTTMENYKQIKRSGKKLVNCMFTVVPERRNQLWAVGEHRDKTEVRLTVDVGIKYKEMEFPYSDAELRHKLVRLGAVSSKGLMWRSDIADNDVEDDDEDDDEDDEDCDIKIRRACGNSDSLKSCVNMDYYQGAEMMNWVIGSGLVYHEEIWNEKLRRYVAIEPTLEEKRDDIISKLHEVCWFDPNKNLIDSKWYRKRWNDFYYDKLREYEELMSEE